MFASKNAALLVINAYIADFLPYSGVIPGTESSPLLAETMLCFLNEKATNAV